MWQPGWEGSLGEMDTCMAESIHCSPETITTLLISYTPIQNKKFKKQNNLMEGQLLLPLYGKFPTGIILGIHEGTRAFQLLPRVN